MLLLLFLQEKRGKEHKYFLTSGRGAAEQSNGIGSLMGAPPEVDVVMKLALQRAAAVRAVLLSLQLLLQLNHNPAQWCLRPCNGYRRLCYFCWQTRRSLLRCWRSRCWYAHLSTLLGRGSSRELLCGDPHGCCNAANLTSRSCR